MYAPPPPVPGPGGWFDGARDPDDLGRPLYGATFGQAVARLFKNYARFHGRASLSEYWWAQLFHTVLLLARLVPGGIAFLVDGVPGPTLLRHDAADWLALMALVGALLGYALLLVPMLALSWRRLQDANLAGPLALLVFAPYGAVAVHIMALMGPKPQGRRFDR